MASLLARLYRVLEADAKSFQAAYRATGDALYNECRTSFKPHIFIQINEKITPLVSRAHFSKHQRIFIPPDWVNIGQKRQFEMVISLFRHRSKTNVFHCFTVTGFRYHRKYDEAFDFDHHGQVLKTKKIY